MAEWMQVFNINFSIFTPRFEIIQLEQDEEWNKLEALRKNVPISEASAIRIELSDSTKLYDENGTEMNTLQYLLTSLVPKLKDLPPARQKYTFDKPTFVQTQDTLIPRMKIKAIDVLISNQLTKMEYQLKGEDFVGYILKNVIEGTERTIPRKLLEK